MSPRMRQAGEVVIARSKRTGERYATRTSNLKGRHGMQGPDLHYTDTTRLEACRCPVPQDHQKPYPVSDDDSNLAIAVIRYMDKFDLESCHQPVFYRYRERQKIDWALKSVHAERFHYTNKEKNVVCRCNDSKHLSYRRVHNPEIQELCAEFFLLETTEVICTRDQWRASEGGAKTTPTQAMFSLVDFMEPVSRYTSLHKGPFEYDNASVVKLFQVREARSMESRNRRSSLSLDEDFGPDGQDMAHLSSGPNGEVDIPETVWRVSRPSVYLRQEGFDSLISTPIGSSPTPVQHNRQFDHEQRQRRPSTLQVGATAPGLDQDADEWDDVEDSQRISVLDEPIKHLGYRTYGSSRDTNGSRSINFDISGLEVRFSGTSESATSDLMATPTILAELTSLERAIELDASFELFSPPSHHSPTLFELEGGSREQITELPGRSSTTMSEAKFSSRRLTCLINQALEDITIPCQEDFFIQRVEVCSRARPAPLGDCSLCQNTLCAPNKTTIHLTCGHFVHQECLIHNFRVLGLEYGNCPVCGMALCERTLHDRIDTDREAIFGRTFTNLKAEERIDFAQRGESVFCWSEEEIAAAQLRLLKDYVDAHADELYGQWRQNGLEPDWHNAVVTPVVQLFKGWNLSTQKCRYFADHDAFYKLVVWAELVRLMNTIRSGVKTLYGKDAPFPQLSELHRKFMMAKERYEKEKKTRRTNRAGVLECEKVAQDAFSMAVSTHPGCHEE